MIPTLAFPPATPFTLQASAVSEVPVTIAAYCEEVPSVTLVAPSRSTVTADAPVGVWDCDCAASATTRLCEAVGPATLVAIAAVVVAVVLLYRKLEKIRWLAVGMLVVVMLVLMVMLMVT